MIDRMFRQQPDFWKPQRPSGGPVATLSTVLSAVVGLAIGAFGKVEVVRVVTAVCIGAVVAACILSEIILMLLRFGRMLWKLGEPLEPEANSVPGRSSKPSAPSLWDRQIDGLYDLEMHRHSNNAFDSTDRGIVGIERRRFGRGWNRR